MFIDKDIIIDNGWISVNGIGRIGLWWSKFDHKVCIDFSLGGENSSFIAHTLDEVKNGILKLLNK